MKYKAQLKLLRIIFISVLSCGCAQTAEMQVNFDEILATTPYAALLKELICLTDTIGLLRHRIQSDERRFIEDSVLGKTVRAHHLMEQVDFDHTLQDDIDYLFYWLSVAQSEPTSELLTQQIAELKRQLHEYIGKGLQLSESS